jgi:hypothetical protein
MDAKAARQLTEKAKAEAKLLQEQEALQIVQTQRIQILDKIRKAAENRGLWIYENAEIFSSNLKYLRDLGYKVEQKPAYGGTINSLISWEDA